MLVGRGGGIWPNRRRGARGREGAGPLAAQGGETTRAQVEGAGEGERPDFVVENVMELAELLAEGARNRPALTGGLG